MTVLCIIHEILQQLPFFGVPTLVPDSGTSHSHHFRSVLWLQQIQKEFLTVRRYGMQISIPVVIKTESKMAYKEMPVLRVWACLHCEAVINVTASYLGFVGYGLI